MKKISVVIEVKPEFITHFRQSRRRRLLRQVSKQLSRGFTTIGIYHSHNTERKGGEFLPHVHLIVSVPDEKLEQYLDQLPSDLLKKDKTGYFQLSDRKRWVLDFNDSLLTYCLGSGRKHLPEIVYGRV
jgi:nitrogen regulatory protein PII